MSIGDALGASDQVGAKSGPAKPMCSPTITKSSPCFSCSANPDVYFCLLLSERSVKLDVLVAKAAVLGAELLVLGAVGNDLVGLGGDVGRPGGGMGFQDGDTVS